MRVTLEKLRSNTVFKLEGRTWMKSAAFWGYPKKEFGASEDIIGKPCVKCSPKLGEVFQSELQQWIPTETVVDVDWS